MKIVENLVKEDFENLTDKINNVNETLKNLTKTISDSLNNDFNSKIDHLVKKLESVEIKINQIIG